MPSVAELMGKFSGKSTGSTPVGTNVYRSSTYKNPKNKYVAKSANQIRNSYAAKKMTSLPTNRNRNPNAYLGTFRNPANNYVAKSASQIGNSYMSEQGTSLPTNRNTNPNAYLGTPLSNNEGLRRAKSSRRNTTRRNNRR
jgi:hypothetical protein